MKKLLLPFLLIIFMTSGIFAQCETESSLDTAGKVLTELQIDHKSASQAEYLLTLKAAVPGASWGKHGAEAAVLTVFVDGKYNQDMILFAGSEVFEYRALLGGLSAGNHKIGLVLNEARSAPNAKRVKIRSLAAVPFENLPANRPVPAYIATRNAPLIYLRPATIDKFSDIPLLTFYEIFDETAGVRRIRYTTIFTNEDGGTAAAALMARWGRMTDIEWIYEIRVRDSGEILSEIYQGANHETKNFRGKRFSAHPLLLDATVNNNFADTGCSALRVSPMLIRSNLAGGSRETVMDSSAWTYRIMAEEAFRERRVDAAKLDAETIADPRDYFYMEIQTEPENAAVAVELGNGAEKSSSDFGDPRLRVSRPGFVRIAVRKPVGLKKDFPASAELICSPAASDKKGVCRNLKLVKIVRLDRDFRPREKRLNAESQTVETGGKAVFKIR